MGQKKNLTGQKFGRLTAISENEQKSRRVLWNCLCDCGNYCVVRSTELNSRHVRSCGCLYEEYTKSKTFLIIDDDHIECLGCNKIKNSKDFYYRKDRFPLMPKGNCKECYNKKNNIFTEEEKIIRNEKRKEKYKNNPSLKLRNTVSQTIYAALKRNHGSKRGSSILDYLPYTIEELKNHIENTWSLPENLDENGNVWMNWENYGSVKFGKKNWQIDHIKPQTHPDCQYISLDDPKLLVCWALNNLRAFESFANLKKGNKYQD